MALNASLYWRIVLSRAALERIERNKPPVSDAEAEALLEYFGA